jgi:16S rRNA (guanine966-N2)-methyltransferase
MRIVGGKLKGRKLFLPNPDITRPLRDLVKENIFNIIHHSNLLGVSLEKSSVLDLYSGSGSFGIECISRGAKYVTFVENNVETIKVLNKNLMKFSLKSKYLLIEKEINKSIELIHQDEKFNIFFLDPPFSDTKYLKILDLLKTKKLYKKKHFVIIHRENSDLENVKNNLNILLVKKYGRSRIVFGNF